MGLDVTLVSKGRGENRIFYNDLSRNFCNFLCGPDAFEDSEFDQLQRITGLNLNLFRSIPVNLEPNVAEMEYQLYLAEEENDTFKMKEIRKEIARTEIEWSENYELINEGWTKVDELIDLTENLILELCKEDELGKRLNYNLNWGRYFENTKRKINDDSSYLENNFLEDVYSLLKGLKVMSERKITYVTFSYD